jgi:hypothetical protein
VIAAIAAAAFVVGLVPGFLLGRWRRLPAPPPPPPRSRVIPGHRAHKFAPAVARLRPVASSYPTGVSHRRHRWQNDEDETPAGELPRDDR